jgi:hypothetical protein
LCDVGSKTRLISTPAGEVQQPEVAGTDRGHLGISARLVGETASTCRLRSVQCPQSTHRYASALREVRGSQLQTPDIRPR